MNGMMLNVRMLSSQWTITGGVGFAFQGAECPV